MFFPTGTQLKTTLWTYENVDVMEVEIFPSFNDVKVSQGLCGTVGLNSVEFGDGSGRRKTDFSARSDRHGLDDFSLSWKCVSNIVMFFHSYFVILCLATLFDTYSVPNLNN